MQDAKEPSSSPPTSQRQPARPDDEPFFKFWRHHWLGNVRLRTCSVAARALMTDLMALTDADGYVRAPMAAIERVFGEPVSQLIAELESAGVLHRGTADLLLVRTIARSYFDKVNGKRGGRPDLKKRGGSTQNPQSRVQPKRIEDRGQRIDTPPPETSSPPSEVALRATVEMVASPTSPKPRPRSNAAHVPVMELFQRGWALYKHELLLARLGVVVRIDTPVAEIPKEALYLPTTADWKAAADLLRFARGDFELVKTRMLNAFESKSAWVVDHLSPRLIAAHWNQFVAPINGFEQHSNGRH